jgi:septum site-determining protein MinC
MSLKKTPFFELRSGSVDTLLFVVKTTDLDALRTELTRRFEATPEFFANDTVAIDVRRLAADERISISDSRVARQRAHAPDRCSCVGQQAWASEARCRCWKHATGGRCQAGSKTSVARGASKQGHRGRPP